MDKIDALGDLDAKLEAMQRGLVEDDERRREEYARRRDDEINADVSARLARIGTLISTLGTREEMQRAIESLKPLAIEIIQRQ